MGSVYRFKQIMSELGYELDEQEGLKLTYKKNAKFSILVLVINLELKYINPILVPSSVMMLERDFITMRSEFDLLRNEAEIIAKKSNGVLQILN